MNIEEQVKVVIEKIRPYIQHDGGDVEFVKLENATVTVRMLGACIGCMAIEDTLKLGIEAMIIDEVPEIKEVVLEEPTLDYYYR